MFVWRPARWANWMFEIEQYDAATNNFTFGHGGFQGARGDNSGGDFFIENGTPQIRPASRLAHRTNSPFRLCVDVGALMPLVDRYLVCSVRRVGLPG